MLKVCKTCLVEKDESDFYKDANSATGYRRNCKLCKNKETLVWRNKNRAHYNAIARKHHAKHKERDRLYRYDMTPVQYRAILASQDSKCAICNKENPSKKRALAIDHEHTTKKIRGILCYKCNRDMNVVDDLEQLSRCIAYREKHK